MFDYSTPAKLSYLASSFVNPIDRLSVIGCLIGLEEKMAERTGLEPATPGVTVE